MTVRKKTEGRKSYSGRCCHETNAIGVIYSEAFLVEPTFSNHLLWLMVAFAYSDLHNKNTQ